MATSRTTPETITAAAAALRRGALTSLDLVESALAAIAAHQPATNAFILVDGEGARAAARAADEERRLGQDRGPLHGIPVSVKDLIDVAGARTTAASRVLAGENAATLDAPVVARLREAGAVIVGKTNLHEFALGTTSEDSAWGPVRHPRDPHYVAGGSSGGSAVAVATGMGLASIGTDTGGSIRIPASACGVVGLKPSYEDVPADGVVPLSTSLDHVGPLARTVADAAIVWRAIATAPGDAVTPPSPGSLRLARLHGYFEAVVPEVHAAYERSCARLEAAGARIERVSLPDAAAIRDVYTRIVLAEAAAWHARFLDTRPAGYSPVVRARLLQGRDVSAVDYLAAREAARSWRRVVDALLGGGAHDALVLPTLPVLAPRLGQDDVEIDGAATPVRAAMLRNTQLFDITGHPAVSLPMPTAGWPCGLQLVGRRGQTPALLALAAACERAIA